MNNNTNKNSDSYGNLLDKYLEPTHLEWSERQKREKEAKTRYNNLLDKAKPDYSMLELMAEMEDGRLEHWKKMEAEKELGTLRIQERIEEARRREEEHNAEVKGYMESIMARKEEKRLAAEKKMTEEREAEAKQKEIYDRIDGLMKISPESANAYIQAMKKANVI